MIKQLQTALFLLFILCFGHAQTKEPSAILQLDSNTQGLLLPRMTDTDRNAIDNPALGLVIFNTTSNTLNFFDGVSWQQINTTELFTPIISGVSYHVATFSSEINTFSEAIAAEGKTIDDLITVDELDQIATDEKTNTANKIASALGITLSFTSSDQGLSIIARKDSSTIYRYFTNQGNLDNNITRYSTSNSILSNNTWTKLLIFKN